MCGNKAMSMTTVGASCDTDVFNTCSTPYQIDLQGSRVLGWYASRTRLTCFCCFLFNLRSSIECSHSHLRMNRFCAFLDRLDQSGGKSCSGTTGRIRCLLLFDPSGWDASLVISDASLVISDASIVYLWFKNLHPGSTPERDPHEGGI